MRPSYLRSLEESATAPIIAIVDDDESVRSALKRLLKSVGLRAETFSSSEEFMASGDPGGTDCLLLDVHLPGMDGFELRGLLADSGSDIPVIFITADREGNAHQLAQEVGAVGYLEKPFSDQFLLEIIHVALGSGHREDQTSRD